MDRTQKVTLTNLCMVSHGNQVLVEDKVNGSWNGITFPGGHVEPQESFADAVIREVYEETGLTIRSPRLCGIKDWVESDGSRYMVLLYQTDQFSGELKSSEEGAVFWVPLEQLPTMHLAYDMEALLKVFLDEHLSEFYYSCQNGGWTYEFK